jgi:serine/threonine-protein kinase HipA
MSRSLDVYLSEHLVGRLTQESGQMCFAYDPGWIDSPAACPLSHSLPLREERFDSRSCRPFFAGLLPEAEPRRRIARALGITARNDFALLDRIGGECAGAVTFIESGSAPPSAPTPADYRVLSSAELATVLRELPERPLLAGERGVRLSLAGAQDKLPVLLVDGSVALPLYGAPSSHIVKPQIRDLGNTVENEALCLLLARHLGLHVIDAEVRRAESEPYLLVRRYDRARDADGTLRRLHQEDFCQALGIPPELKYEAEGGPKLADCFALVRRAASRPVVDLARLLDMIVFNALVGNHDAHGKNYSLLYTSEAAELAPLYDSLATTVYPGLSSRFAMKIGGKYELRGLMPRHWERFAREAQLGPALVRARVADLARRMSDALDGAANALIAQGCVRETIDPIAHAVERRSAAVLRAFEAPTS